MLKTALRNVQFYIHLPCTRQLKWKLTRVQTVSALGSTSRRLIWATTVAQTIGFYLPGSFIMSISFFIFQPRLYGNYRTLFMKISCRNFSDMRCSTEYAYYALSMEYREYVVKEDNIIYGIQMRIDPSCSNYDLRQVIL